MATSDSNPNAELGHLISTMPSSPISPSGEAPIIVTI